MGRWLLTWSIEISRLTGQWTHIADRIVQGLAVQAGELIQVRDGAGRYEVLKEILLAIERAGATPLVQIMTEDYLHRLWKDAPQEYLSNWDQHRLSWAQQSQRRIRLVGAEGDGIDTIPDAALAAGMAAWSKAAQRLAGLEDEQISPFMLIAVPTEEGAKKLGVCRGNDRSARTPSRRDRSKSRRPRGPTEDQGVSQRVRVP